MPPDAPAYAPPGLALADLMRVHPLWLRHREEWLRIRDVTSGALGDKARLSSYVPRAKREYDEEYAARLAMTEVVPECMVVRDRIIGALFSVKPTRDLPDALAKWAASVDGRGQSIDHFLEAEVMQPALDYGAAHVLVDRPSDGGMPPADRAEQERRRLLWPVLAVYAPLEVRQWRFGEDGALDWVMIVEEGWLADEVTGKRSPVRTYRRFDRDGWARWEVTPKKDGDSLPVESWTSDGESTSDAARADVAARTVNVSEPTFGRHGAPGMVPLVSFIPSRIEELIGRSTVGPVVHLDLRLARLESDRAWDLYVHAHPFLMLKTSRQLAEVGAGANEVLKLNPDEKEDGEYLTLPSESFAARERAIHDTRVDIYRHVGIDPMGVVTDGGPNDASGVARAWSFSMSEARHLGRLADRVESGESKLFALAAIYAAVDAPKEGAIKWPETFETAAPTQLIEDSIAFRQACRSETAQRLLEKRLARVVLGEIDPKQETAIDSEIDGAAEVPTIEPAVAVAQ